MRLLFLLRENAVVGVAAVLVPLFAPGRDGEQLPAVRRLRGVLANASS